jgi:hypothetical protein
MNESRGKGRHTWLPAHRNNNFHPITDTISHASVAPGSTIQALNLGRSCQTSKAKANSPMLPTAEPAASTPTACRARLRPSKPSFSFFRLSCFSMSVALAGKIAGNARNSPPGPGPHSFAIIPAIAVTNPPPTNRTAYSYHLVCPKTEVSTLISILYFSSTYHSPNATPSHPGIEQDVTTAALSL